MIDDILNGGDYHKVYYYEEEEEYLDAVRGEKSKRDVEYALSLLDKYPDVVNDNVDLKIQKIKLIIELGKLGGIGSSQYSQHIGWETVDTGPEARQSFENKEKIDIIFDLEFLASFSNFSSSNFPNSLVLPSKYFLTLFFGSSKTSDNKIFRIQPILGPG